MHKSSLLLPKLFDVRILFHPTASNPEGPDPPFVFAAAVFIDSAVIVSKRIGCMFFGSSMKEKEGSGSSGGGVFPSGGVNFWSRVELHHFAYYLKVILKLNLSHLFSSDSGKL